MARGISALFLSLVLALTSLSMAVARGQGRQIAGEEIVICTGVGITTITVDANGNPVKTIHMCPDAMMQMAAAFQAPVMPIPCKAKFVRQRPANARHAALQEALSPLARGPPEFA